MNCINMVGQLTREIEIKFTQSGLAVAKGTVFVKEWKKDKDDEFHHFDFTAFGKQAEWLGDAKKSDHIMIVGRLQQDKWETKEGEKRSKVCILANEIRNLDSNKANTGINQKPKVIEPVTDENIPF